MNILFDLYYSMLIKQKSFRSFLVIYILVDRGISYSKQDIRKHYILYVKLTDNEYLRVIINIPFITCWARSFEQGECVGSWNLLKYYMKWIYLFTFVMYV